MSGRLRRVDCSAPGISRRRRGRGFEYLDEDGNRIEDPEVLERIGELVIPPAWKDVWICPFPMGHIQATGIDARGRKQYVYHRKWRERRDQEKFDEMVRFARCLPQLRRRVKRDLRRPELDQERVLACAVRLLDRGFFRIGGEDYAESNDSYGLATMRKEHVTLTEPDLIRFDYPAKSGKRREQSVVDPEVFEIVQTLKRRRARRRRAARVQGRQALDRRPLRGHQRIHQGRSPTRTSRRRRSAPGTPPCSPPSRWRCQGRPRTARRPRASAP